MDTPRGQYRGPLDDLSEKTRDQLLRWDELTSRDLDRLANDPSTAARLELLQASQRWLESAAPHASEPCPSAEELYDLGQGPGARAPRSADAARLRRHVEACAECRALVQTLGSAPPSPLLLDPEPETELVQEPEATPAPLLALPPTERRAPSPLRRLAVPLAAAAAVVAVLALWKSGGPRDSVLAAVPDAFPETSLLRGGADALAHPRGLVLARDAALGSWAAELTFELRPDVAYDAYRVEVRRHDGDAFDAGEPVAELTSETPLVAADAALLAALAPGRYTWEAFGVHAGLERPLGARDFEVRSADVARDALTEALAEGPLGARAVRWLHEQGFVSDAHRLARTLPASPERDAYLASDLR